MTKYRDTLWCDGCGVEILGPPVAAERREFCCDLCRDGLACECGARAELDGDRRAGAAEAAEIEA